MLRRKFYAALAAVGFSLFGFMGSPLALAKGELENANISIYVFPVGAPQAFIKDNLEYPRGADIDIVHELQRRLKFIIRDNRIKPLHRELAFQRLQTGEADLVIGGISYTDERAKLYDFTPTVYSSGLAILYNPKRHPNLKRLEDIKGLRVGVDEGSTSEHLASLYGGTPVPMQNLVYSYFMVSQGALDAIIYDKPPIADFAQTMTTLDLAVTEETFENQTCQFSFVLAKNSPYTKIISQTIEEMKADGTIDAILERWKIQ